MSTASIGLRELLAEMRTIAIVGLSPDPARPSNQVARFLLEQGRGCVGVNPKIAGQQVHSIPVVARLADIDRPIDMIDIFRASYFVEDIVDDSLALDPRPRVIWMQLGVRNERAKARAEASGLIVVMDNCPKIVLSR